MSPENFKENEGVPELSLREEGSATIRDPKLEISEEEGAVLLEDFNKRICDKFEGQTDSYNIHLKFFGAIMEVNNPDLVGAFVTKLEGKAVKNGLPPREYLNKVLENSVSLDDVIEKLFS